MLEQHPTAFADVNQVLDGFAIELSTIFGERLRGMYLTGSLALGDFDSRTSDIDFIVLTDEALSEDSVEALREMHGRFEAGGSPWAGRVEAVYITPEALQSSPISRKEYPQVEKERALFVAPLEDGWIFHLYTLREHGVTVVGTDVRGMIERVDPDDMRRAAAPMAELWLEQSRNDPTWLPWVRERGHQAFVVLTLCRLLYTLETGAVASKPAAGRWAEGTLGSRWAGLVGRALGEQQGSGEMGEEDLGETVAMVGYAVEQFREWKGRVYS